MAQTSADHTQTFVDFVRSQVMAAGGPRLPRSPKRFFHRLQLELAEAERTGAGLSVDDLERHVENMLVGKFMPQAAAFQVGEVFDVLKAATVDLVMTAPPLRELANDPEAALDVEEPDDEAEAEPEPEPATDSKPENTGPFGFEKPAVQEKQMQPTPITDRMSDTERLFHTRRNREIADAAEAAAAEARSPKPKPRPLSDLALAGLNSSGRSAHAKALGRGEEWPKWSSEAERAEGIRKLEQSGKYKQTLPLYKQME